MAMGEVVTDSKTTAKRQVAVKTWLSDLVKGSYVKVEGDWQPNYVLTPCNIRISRANVVGAVVSEPAVDPGHFSFTLDDGSSKMTVRSFDEVAPKGISLGDVLLVIGRPREFGSEIYMMPEIMKKIKNEKWLEHRKLELDLLYKNLPINDVKPISDIKEESDKSATDGSDILSKAEEEVIEDAPESTKLAVDAIKTKETDSGKEETLEKKQESKQTEPELQQKEPALQKKEPESQKTEPGPKTNPIDKMLELIKGLDSGDGADIEDAISDSALDREKAEAIINNLMMDGEIFEIKPGKLKVME